MQSKGEEVESLKEKKRDWQKESREKEQREKKRGIDWQEG